ncbi:MAG: AI-2E family transporter [Erysipelotrichaceae bacterium]|nr:AI-2E family transporter [Erysipelotrichaceae bacterium]
MNFTRKIRDLDVRGFIHLAGIVVIMILALVYFEYIVRFVMTMIDVFMPVFIGVVLAFIFNMPMCLYEAHLPIKNDKVRNRVSAVLAIITVLLFVVIVLVAVIPQIIENMNNFITNSSTFINNIEPVMEDVLMQLDLPADMMTTIESYEADITDTLLTGVSNWIPNIIDYLTSLSTGVIDLFIGLIMSFYILLSRDMLFRQLGKLAKAIFKPKQYEWLGDFVSLVAVTFGDFIFGQVIEGIIIGVMCYIGCLILKIPYGLICSLVIGVTNVIPYFGPIIGAVVDFLIIFLVDPFQAIVFLIFSTCLQQFECNLIYPHVVGGAIGLSPLWVLLAVSLGGGLFGIPGMVLGLPTFSVIYELVRRWTNDRIAKQEAEQ